MDNFNDAISFVLQKEGGRANVKDDKGGLTRFGISSKAYPSEDIENLSLDRAKFLYKRDYWDKNNLGKIIDVQKATAALDTVVNHGRGPILIQEALSRAGASLKVDGLIGTNTLNAINSISLPKFAGALYDIRKAYYETLVKNDPTQSKFQTGWMNRISWLKTHISGVGSSLATLALLGITAYFFLKKRL